MLAYQIIPEIQTTYNKADALNAIANEYAKIDDPGKAKELFYEAYNAIELIDSVSLKIYALIDTASGYSSIGEQTIALNILKEVGEIASEREASINRNFLPDDVVSGYIVIGELVKAQDLATSPADYSSVAYAYAVSGEYEKAKSIAYRINDKETKNNTLSNIGVSQVQSGHVVDAHIEIYNYDSNLTKSNVLISIIDTYVDSGDTLNAMKTLDEAVDYIDGVDILFNKIILYPILANRYTKLGKKDKAIHLLNTGLIYLSKIIKILPAAIRPLFHSSIFSVSYAKAGEYITALRLAQGNSATLIEIAKEYAENNDMQNANKLIKKVLLDNSDKNNFLISVVNYYASFGLFDDALKLAKSIEYYIDRDNALYRIVIEYAKSGQLSEAFSTVDMIEQPSKKISAYVGMHAVLRGVSLPLEL